MTKDLNQYGGAWSHLFIQALRAIKSSKETLLSPDHIPRHTKRVRKSKTIALRATNEQSKTKRKLIILYKGAKPSHKPSRGITGASAGHPGWYSFPLGFLGPGAELAATAVTPL